MTVAVRQVSPAPPAPTRTTPADGSPRLTEADLWRLWEGQRFPPRALVTVDGLPLRVIYRGRANFGPGPDFRDAIVSSPSGLLEGDVELHVRSTDFIRHGHARDPSYDGVALHVVFRHDGEGPTTLASGRRVPVVALSDWTDRRARELQRWLLSGARYAEPCRSAVERLGPGQAGATLDRLGDMRFRARAAALSKRMHETGPEEALWEAILEAAAYAGADVFRTLASTLPWAKLRSAIAGLPPRERAPAAEARLAEAMDLANAIQGVTPLGLPGFSERRLVRPLDRPRKRLAGVAAIAGRVAVRGLGVTFADVLDEPAAPRRLIALLAVPGAIGRSRALEIATNAVLPWLAASGVEGAAMRAYSALALPARYGNVRHLHEALGSAIPLGARRQQGMLYLLRQYCTQGGCGRCPLS